jgi:hypothetical protein
MARANRPDPQATLRTLKDFQRTSAHYAFHRLYLDADSTHRFLVADEVGLGKTLVARAVVARMLDHLWDSTDRIDIVYICSNADIARQNVRKLDVIGGGVPPLSRITLLPTAVRNLKTNKVNFISLTPSTSLDLASAMGTWRERALLYRLLMQTWTLSPTAARNVLQGTVYDAHRLTLEIRKMERDPQHAIEPGLAHGFQHALERRVAEERAAGSSDLQTRFAALCDSFPRARSHALLPPPLKQERRRIIGELRWLLAESCLEALEPDLIILDEFQRFKYLLRPETEAGGLAKGLFEYQEESARRPRVLLLSATPYKMYTMHHEADTEDHYLDFVDTLKFLLREPRRVEQAEYLLQAYREELYRLSDPGSRLQEVKAELEVLLRSVMCRTERLGVTQDRAGMLQEIPARPVLTLSPRDVRTYPALQRIARSLDHADTLEYWKSAPYLLNFVDDYLLKRRFEESVLHTSPDGDIVEALAATRDLLLPWQGITRYEAVEVTNPRLRALIDDFLDSGIWSLLWLPPSLPYYRLEAPFDAEQCTRLTKRLIFSSWRVVPKVIACLVSYEVERRIFRQYDPTARNTPAARARRRPLLQFTRSDGRLTGMPVLALLYPSQTLAYIGDPLALASHLGFSASLEAAVAEVRRQLEPLLARVTAAASADGPEDESWYWAAPILLDLLQHRSRTIEWWEAPDLPTVWQESGPDQTEDGEAESRWADHVAEARRVALEGGFFSSLGRPPADLAQVMAELAVGGPAVCCLRAISRVCGGLGALSEIWALDAAAQSAHGFRSLFNLPEATTLIRSLNPKEPYWRRVLEYCLAGGLQVVLDEFVHMLYEQLSLQDQPAEKIACEIKKTLLDVLTLRTPNLGVDRIEVHDGTVAVEPQRMRSRFALRFQQDRSEDGEESSRPDLVRQAFNSPFWPFILATTSVGQEGLDFHVYCHAVVHWNLPSNPVDLEQREGRVHRYKGHAIRKNVAAAFGYAAFAGPVRDPWEALFAEATARRDQDTDLVPFWVFAPDGGARIERHVLALPLSRDEQWLETLRRALAVYRMVFGQPRQEDLMAYLLARFPPEELEPRARQIGIDLAPSQIR